MAPYQQTPPSGDDVAGSTIFKKFLGKAETYIKQPTRLKQLLTDAYKKASEKNEVGTLAHEAWETLQTLFRLIKAAAAGEYTGVPTATVLAAVAVLVYFLSPIDVIPDFIPVLGLLDDVALVAWFSTTLKTELDKFHEWELTRPQLAEPAPAATPAASPTPATHYNAASRHGHSTPAAPAAGPDALVPSNESAKHAGTTPTPTYLNTDAGLGSPDSSSSRPVHEAGPDATPTLTAPQGDEVARTSDSSREGNVNAATDTGGNVR